MCGYVIAMRDGAYNQAYGIWSVWGYWDQNLLSQVAQYNEVAINAGCFG